MKSKFLFTLLSFVPTLLLAEDIIPKSFTSPEAAKEYSTKSFAGGSIATYKLSQGEFMVLIIHGSGIPDLAIAAYKKEGDQWKFVKEGERSFGTHSIVQKGDSLIITNSTGFSSLLIESQ